jgi:putative transposase
VCNEQIKEWLCELISDEGEAYGYRKLTHALRRNYCPVINKKKVYRLVQGTEYPEAATKAES